MVGNDKEGIVAAFTNFVFQRSGNIEKVNQNVMKGLFGMYLEVSFTKKININKFDNDLQTLAKKQNVMQLKFLEKLKRIKSQLEKILCHWQQLLCIFPVLKMVKITHKEI